MASSRTELPPEGAAPDGLAPEAWRRIGELFHEALDVAPADRTVWINRVCAGQAKVRRELISLLESDRVAGEGFVEGRLKSAVVSLYNDPASLRPPERIGPYRLLRDLGRGGMGTVYLGERADEHYHTMVAIKLVRPGMDGEFILQRFRRERQILAHLQHPNIARLLDGGTTEQGFPYIVMEYIDGVWITDYCRARSLTIPERLTLFLDVCSAVEHAHQHFVVHRDIKPGNILVDASSSPKLLDFGICKLLHAGAVSTSDTDVSSPRMLTPDYASPEQIRADPITIASDVYSLAAVLYELLVGAKVHRFENCTLKAIERAICEEDIVPPSLAAGKSAARLLHGDLDNILMRALQKDLLRRYPTVEQFSEDLRRHLSHRPVRARPDAVFYRLGKFLRRRRGTVVALAAVIVSLLVGVIVSSHEAQLANRNLLQVRKLAHIFVFDVHDAVRDLPGSTQARKLIVETGLRYLDSMSGSSRRDWELQSDLVEAYRRIGDVQGNVMSANLGDTVGALESYRKALLLATSILGHDPSNRKIQVERVRLYQRIGGIHSFTRDSRQALASFREAERLGIGLLSQYSDSHSDSDSHSNDDEIRRLLAEIQVAAGNVLRTSGDYAASLEENSRGAALLLESLQGNPEDRGLQEALAAAYLNAGIAETRLGRLEEALSHFRRSAALTEKLTNDEPANLSYQRASMLAYSHLGDVLGNPNLVSLGDSEGAITAYRKILLSARHLFLADRADQRAASDYGIALSRMAAVLPKEKVAEKLSLSRESVEVLQGVAHVNRENLSNRNDLAYTQRLLGEALMTAGKRADALRVYRESNALSQALLDAGYTSATVSFLISCQVLGQEAAKMGDGEAALTYARRAMAVSDPASAYNGGRPATLQRFVTPRGPTTMGLVYTALALSKKIPAEKAPSDRRQAIIWLEESRTMWRDLQGDPAFTSSHRSQLHAVETALAALRGRKPQ